jgi:hypothetical protein
VPQDIRFAPGVLGIFFDFEIEKRFQNGEGGWGIYYIFVVFLQQRKPKFSPHIGVKSPP